MVLFLRVLKMNKNHLSIAVHRLDLLRNDIFTFGEKIDLKPLFYSLHLRCMYFHKKQNMTANKIKDSCLTALN